MKRRCLECGDVFDVDPSQVKSRGGGKHCSMACRLAGRARRRDERDARREQTCRQCGKRYKMDRTALGRVNAGKYCSRKCWYTWIGENQKRRVTLICATCGKKFERVAAWAKKNSGATYCSRECQAGGRVRPGSGSSRGRGWGRISEAVRVRDGRRCVRCGKTEAENEMKLSVDHIVPWIMSGVDEEAANHDDNLASLCSVCHGVKTHRIEPRLLKGDWLSLVEFYGQEIADRAMARFTG